MMKRERDHLRPHVRVRVAAQVQIRYACDEPQRLPEIVRAFERLVHGLRAASQITDLDTRAIAMRGHGEACARELREMAKGRYLEPPKFSNPR